MKWFTAEFHINEVQGEWHIIWGNHDQWRSLNNNHRIKSTAEVRTIRREEQKIILCHYPWVSWPDMHQGSWQIHGNSHGNYDHPHLDVGVVDTNNFKPYSFDEIQVKIAAKMANK